MSRSVYGTSWWACALTFVVAAANCSRAPADTGAPPVSVTRTIGTWDGSGDHTIGFTSESGRFRVRWDARLEPGQTDGRLHLMIHSGVSGRPLHEIVDQAGPGAGAVNVEDDPRPFNLMVTASGLSWSIAVDEVVLVRK